MAEEIGPIHPGLPMDARGRQKKVPGKNGHRKDSRSPGRGRVKRDDPGPGQLDHRSGRLGGVDEYV